MRVTKQNLVILVWVLVIMNVAAAVWFAVGIVNSDGKFRFFDDDSVQRADTLADLSLPDEYQMITDYAYHVSEQGNGSTYTCITFVKAKWPVSINGNSGMGHLKEALITKLFGHPYSDMKEALDSVLAKPQFNIPVNAFRRVEERPTSISNLGAEHYYRCFPHCTSDSLLEYKIVRNDYDGTHATHKAGFVHYDRLRQQLITIDMVIDLNKQEQITSLVNERIKHFVDDEQMSLQRAITLPQEFYLGATGIVFVFPEGAIAPTESGVIEIKVDYDKLKPYLTDYYKELLENNANYKELPDVQL